MWDRLGDDKKLYRAEVALYFNLVLDWTSSSQWLTYYRDWNWEHNLLDSYDDEFCLFYCRRADITLFQLARAKDTRTAACVALGDESDMDKFWKSCIGVYERLPIWSAGLLEFSQLLLRPVSSQRHEGRIPDIEVRFIHRSAKEFLTGTTEGQEILRFDSSCFEQRFSSLLHASFFRGLAFRSSGPNQRQRFYLALASVVMGDVVKSIKAVQTRLEKEKWLEGLKACQEFFDHDVGVHDSNLVHQGVLGRAVGLNFKEYIDHAFNAPSQYTPEYKSYLLLCTDVHKIGIFTDEAVEGWTAWLKTTNSLLSLGCKSDFAITCEKIPGTEFSSPIKSTGLEHFLRGLSWF